MKKLLLSIFLLFSLIAPSQPIGVKNGQSHIMFKESFLSTGINSPLQKPHKQQPNKITTISTIRFSGSMNIYSVLNPNQKLLQYNEDLNAVSFIQRKSPTYTASSNSNAGTIVGLYTNDNGLSWDSTCLWSNANYLARFPQGAIYNPPGNTNINNAYIVACGPFLNTLGNYSGNWYASKSLSGGGTNNPGADQQAALNSAASTSLNVHHRSEYGFSITDDGLVHVLGKMLNDPNSSSLGTYGLRGAALVNGVFSAGAFSWTLDSIIPATITRPVDGTKYLNDWPLQAWSENGQIGYVLFLGVRSGAAPVNKSYQPIVYKTTNAGMTWSLLPPIDCTANPTFLNRMWPLKNNSMVVPYFSTREGWDATVDVNGQLHFACTVVGAYTSNNDSLDFIHSFGPHDYDFPMTGPFGYPVIYDFFYNFGGALQFSILDSMGTTGVLSGPSYSVAPWSNGIAGKLQNNARIQIGRTSDGKQIFYSWTESDSTFTAPHKWNIFPDIVVKGYDVTTSMFTPRLGNASGTSSTYTSVTTGQNDVDGAAFWHFMSPKVINTGVGSWEIPITVSNNSVLDGSVAIDHYYLKGVSVAQTNFSISPMNVLSGNCVQTSLNSKSLSLEMKGASIYPNPFSHYLSINLENNDTQVFKIKIFDLTGRIVMNELIPNDSEIMIRTDELSEGIYVLELQTSSGTQRFKLVKQLDSHN